MKNDKPRITFSAGRNRSIRRSRPFLFALLLIAGLVSLAVGGGLLPGRSFASGSDQDNIPPQSISAEAMQQIQALEDEKAARTTAQQKIDSQLIYATKMARSEPIAPGVSTLQVGVDPNDQGKVIVDITASVDEQLLRMLANNGARVLVSEPDYHNVRVEVSLDRLEDIAASSSVRIIQPKQEYILSQSPVSSGPVADDVQGSSDFQVRAQRVRTQLSKALNELGENDKDDNPLPPAFGTSVGSQQSEGDVTHRANTARGTFNVDGTGIKIGVLSNGVVNLAASQAAGDLGPVTILPGQTGSGDEGTAMLEIVHDLAPGAQLFFATANSTPGTFATNIRNLRTAGCDIIIDDVFYFVETPFQDGQDPAIVSNTNGGAVTQAVNDVTAAGALYFSSAGNDLEIAKIDIAASNAFL